MFAQAHHPSEPLAPEELDLYLSKGWFRMGQRIFTCTYIGLIAGVYRVFWLRVDLRDFSEDKTFKKLSKLNSKFSIKIQKASITPEKEALYQSYRSTISFDAPESLEHLLYRGAEDDVFNTLEVNIHDGDKLIAVGYFDIGKNSAAGISSFYDPAYKKYSLGKYLIYQKMLHCKKQEMDYFYPGYFAPGCRAFDYKLEIGKSSLEYYNLSSQQWHGMSSWNPVYGSIEETRQKLTALQQQLGQVNIENNLFRYAYFQANLIAQFQEYELFDYLMFVYCFPLHPDVINPIVVYDFRDRKYHLLRCLSLGMPEDPEENPQEYSSHLLVIKDILYSTPDAEDLTKVIARAFKGEDFLRV